MTSSTQFIGQQGGAPAFAGFGGFSAQPRDDAGRGGAGRDAEVRDEAGRGELPGRTGQSERPALPGREAGPSPSNVVRLPGQEGTGDGGPRRPLISGGAFTLAVAIGLSLDQSTLPDSLQPATPATAGQPAEEPVGDEADATNPQGLTEAEQELVEELRSRDAEVRRHEAAHAAAGGQYAGSPTFTYQTGPDGRQYAVGGEVSIDSGPVKGDPEATLRKAQQIKAAANAPADPSSQDRRVAAQADALRQQAQAEIAAERQQERQVAEAEAAETDAARAERAAAQEEPAPAAGEAPGAAAAQAAATSGTEDRGTDNGAGADRSAATVANDGASGFFGAGGDDRDGDEDDARPRFAASAFSAAAASYRGPTAAPSLVSIAV